MDTTLLVTKLYIPQVRARLVNREHLLEKLQEGLQRGCQLTLIAAPAGYGKTTLIAEWIRDQNLPAAWVTLDEGDNDGVRFLNYLVAGLQAVQSGLAQPVLNLLQSPQPPRRETLLALLINELSTVSGRFLIVFDDYHLIHVQAVHDAMAFLLEHLPPQAHLVIATRADPPLPVARLRGRGLLNELRLADLRFSPQETGAMTELLLGRKLPEEVVSALLVRTEGWAAGLQMASLALQADLQDGKDFSGFLADFSGSHRFILDYLLEEVFQSQPEQIQSFFMRTAVLDRMCASLCDTLTGEIGKSQAILEMLERANLFIIPLDDRREWYRYHQLFADLLRMRLSSAQPDLMPALHRRAAEWLAQHRALPEAILHALAAQDDLAAADFIEQAVEETLGRSQIVTFMRWCRALPEAVLRTHPRLGVLYAWGMLIEGQAVQAVEERLQSLQGEAEQVAIYSAPLRSYIAILKADAAQAFELARWAMQVLPRSEAFLRCLAVLSLASAYMLEYESAEGLRVLGEAAQISRESGAMMVTVLVLDTMAETYLKMGQLRKARQYFQEALEEATLAPGRYLPIAFRPLAGLANLARECNDLPEASRLLVETEQFSGLWMQSGALMPLLNLAQIRLALGDYAGAQRIVDGARQVASKTAVTRLDDLVVAMFQVQLWIRQGKLDLAEQWAQERKLEAGPAAPGSPGFLEPILKRLWKYECLALARLRLAQKKPAQAVEILDQVQPALEQLERITALIETLLLRSLALHDLGESQAALDCLRRAVRLAQPEGFMRTFLDEGEAARRLLETLFKQIDQTDSDLKAYLHRVLSAFTQPAAAEKVKPELPRSPERILTQAEPDALTEREMSVLRLLQSPLTAEQIASEMVVSVHTTRSHIKNIYSKLGAHSRLEAIENARRRNLL